MERKFPIDIPQDIMYDILSRLSVKSLCRFKCVSKQWLALINDPQFIKNRSQNQLIIVSRSTSPYTAYSLTFGSLNEPIIEHKLFSEPLFHIISSCYGVLLISQCGFLPFSLWNPLTKNTQLISSPPGYSLSRFLISGLGYDSITHDFKVIATNWSHKIPSPNHVYVFSSRSSSWTITGDFPYMSGPDVLLDCEDPIAVNGTPYWVVKKDQNSGLSSAKNAILYFDPREETFSLLPHPKTNKKHQRFRLTSLGGNLCLVESHEEGVDVWVRKESFWSKLFFVSRTTYYGFLNPLFANRKFCYEEFSPSFFKPLCFAGEGDGEVVAVIAGFLVKYNMHERKFQRIEIAQRYMKYFQVVCHAESLMSLSLSFGTEY